MNVRTQPAVEVDAELEAAIEAAFEAQTGLMGMAVLSVHDDATWYVEAAVPRDDEVTPWQGGDDSGPWCCYCGLGRADMGGVDVPHGECVCSQYHRTWEVTDLGETWPRATGRYARFFFKEI